MSNIFKYIYYIVLFVVLQAIAIYFFLGKDDSLYMKRTNFTNKIHSKISNVTDYFVLKRDNKNLLNEIDILHNSNLQKDAELLQLREQIYEFRTKQMIDTVLFSNNDFDVRSAKIINISNIRGDNVFDVDLGAKDSVKLGMAVVDGLNVVGTVIDVNENYSTVRSVLSEYMKFAGSLKNDSSYCSIKWGKENISELMFLEMTKYADVKVGDTIVTASFSKYFPQNFVVGVISEMTLVNDMTYEGTIVLPNNLRKLKYVSLIDFVEDNNN